MTALVREVEEELGLPSRAGRFLGTVEHAFHQDGVFHSEMNVVFELTIEGLAAGVPPRSAEPHLDFRWCPLATLGDSDLEPAPLRTCLPRWLASGKAGWASTIESN